MYTNFRNDTLSHHRHNKRDSFVYTQDRLKNHVAVFDKNTKNIPSCQLSFLLFLYLSLYLCLQVSRGHKSISHLGFNSSAAETKTYRFLMSHNTYNIAHVQYTYFNCVLEGKVLVQKLNKHIFIQNTNFEILISRSIYIYIYIRIY